MNIRKQQVWSLFNWRVFSTLVDAMHTDVFNIYIKTAEEVTKLPFFTDREFCMVQSVSQELELRDMGFHGHRRTKQASKYICQLSRIQRKVPKVNFHNINTATVNTRF